MVSTALIACALLGLGAWWVVARPESARSGVLHRFQTQDFHSLAFDPVDADTIYFGHHQGLQVSHDAGRHWQDAALAGVDAMQLAMPAADASRRYAAGHNAFYVSTDGGASWQSQPNNLPGLDLHSFAGSPSDPLRLYAAPVGQGLFTSADGGTTWNRLTLPPSGETTTLALAVDPADALHLFAGVGDQLAESEDGGQTWRLAPGPGSAIISVAADPWVPGGLYAGTDHGLAARSPDGVWRPLGLAAHGAVLAVAVSPAQPRRVAAIDQQGNFFRSDDGGASWAAK